MSWNDMSQQDWQETLEDMAEAHPSALVSQELLRYDYAMGAPFEGGATCAVHDGPLEIGGDFTPPRLLSLVLGDLTVSGRVSTQDVDGSDGNASLVVIGNLFCDTVVNDWASILFVTGDTHAREWAFSGREDSSFVVGGTFRTPLYVGHDIWVSVGKAVEMEHALGFGLYIEEQIRGTKQLTMLPAKHGEAETLALLGLADDPDFEETLDRRLYETGTLLP